MVHKWCQQKNKVAKHQTQINIKSLPPPGEIKSALWGVYFPCLFFTEYNILKLCHFFEAQSALIFELPRHRRSLTFFGVFFSRQKKATEAARNTHGSGEHGEGREWESPRGRCAHSTCTSPCQGVMGHLCTATSMLLM